MQILTTELQFPEGPIALPDGSILLVEIARGTLSRVTDGKVEVVAKLGGGPNGAAMGPDGHCYVCNNGGFDWIKRGGKLYPGEQPADYVGGAIQRVDINTGQVETVFTACDGIPLKGPNDIVFDATGGFWFTDHGKTRARERDRTGVFYVSPDCAAIREVIFPMEGPNGIGLSAAEDEVYVAETVPGRLWAYPLSGAGELDSDAPRRLLLDRPGLHMFDSLAVDAEGGVAVATILDGGVTTLYPDDRAPQFFATDDRLTTNICFGSTDLRTAYITLSSTGQLLSTPWHCPGLPLNFLNK